MPGSRESIQQAVEAYSRHDGVEAERLCRLALDAEADCFDALILLGVIAAQTDRMREAVELFGRAVAANPNDALAHFHRGNALLELKRPDEALASYERAIKFAPNFAKAYNNRGLALKELNRLNEALANYDHAIRLKPGYEDACNNRGITLKELGRLDEALASYEQSIKLKPDHPEAHYNRGNVLQDLKRPDEALASYEQAIKLKPGYAAAHNNRGLLLKEQNRLDEALASYERAIQLEPGFAEACNNRGVALSELKRLAEALASHEQAIELKPDYAEGHWNLALCSLSMGDFARGWEEYEWRWANKALELPVRNFAQPRWRGEESLSDKTIFLYGEQGLGDTLQFCRYAKLVSGLGARVILEAPEPLLSLLKNLDGVDALVEEGGVPPGFDYHCPLLSLPLAFKTGLETIPSANGYIASSPEKVAEWREKLGDRTKPRIGLAWSGSAGYKDDSKRSIALGELVKRLPRQYQYVSLQKEVKSGDQELLNSHPNILHFGAAFADTAALCDLMDVVISVDTAIAHLAGAMGKPVWVLLSYIPDWRWLLERSDSPWYSSARLFRQDTRGDWTGVIDKVSSTLERI